MINQFRDHGGQLQHETLRHCLKCTHAFPSLSATFAVHMSSSTQVSYTVRCIEMFITRAEMSCVVNAGSGKVFGVFCVINLIIFALAGFFGVTATSMAMRTFR